MTPITPTLHDTMTVDLPEGELDGQRIERFTIGAVDPGHFREALRGRAIRPSTYTKFTLNGRLTTPTFTFAAIAVSQDQPNP